MDNLKPCPLCGKPAQIKSNYKPFVRGWVGCPECHLYINWQHDPFYTVQRWNRRVNDGTAND